MSDMLLTAHTVRMGALTLVMALLGIGALIARFVELIDHVDKPPAVDPADELRAGDDLVGPLGRVLVVAMGASDEARACYSDLRSGALVDLSVAELRAFVRGWTRVDRLGAR
jgi:hypothetical protein